MTRVAALGISNFEKIAERKKIFYVDKTHFIKEWWECEDEITLITRPRRFGKTLTLSMVETFFSIRLEGRSELFEDYNIWKEAEFRKLQGTYPVLFLSLADVKQGNYQSMAKKMKMLISELFAEHNYLLDSENLSEIQKKRYLSFADGKEDDEEYMRSLKFLSKCLYLHYGKKSIILIDEYDTPMLEAYMEGFWEEAIVYIRRLQRTGIQIVLALRKKR